MRKTVSMSEPLTGGCLCGAVRFEVSAPPTDAGYCHCTRCQRRSGTAVSAQAHIDSSTFELLDGEVTWWRHADGGGEKGFCAICGGHLFSRNPDDLTRLNVRMAAFDRDPGVRPSYRAFVAYAAPWEPIPDDGLPRHPERRPA